jgi:DNA (cytosine-5)-methyltransferase 1
MFPLEGYDFIWASPVCKRFSSATRTSKTVENWPDQIDPIRELLTASGAAWVIENVTTAPIRSDVLLCGAMFNLRTYRHRVFESNFFLFQPPHPKHTAPIVKMGRQPSPEQFINPVGNFIDVRAGRIALDIDWMTRDELAQSIPPAYSEFIGKQIISQLSREAA